MQVKKRKKVYSGEDGSAIYYLKVDNYFILDLVNKNGKIIHCYYYYTQPDVELFYGAKYLDFHLSSHEDALEKGKKILNELKNIIN